LNVGDASHPHFLSLLIRGCTWSSNKIKSAFEKGEFSIRQTSGSFNGIWSDMGNEKTIIKDSKGSGGIVGM
jgi:hypothetical protein